MGLNSEIRDNNLVVSKENPVLEYEKEEVEVVEKNVNLFDVLKVLYNPMSWDITFLTPNERAPHGYAWIENPFDHKNDWAYNYLSFILIMMLFGMFYYKQNMFFNDTTAPAN